MLLHSGISNTYIYSDLDPVARKINSAKFQTGSVNVLLVTDVAARGIDIPQLDYVINYNFPDKPKLFVHRVGKKVVIVAIFFLLILNGYIETLLTGRCARAGRKGEAFSLVTTNELCYLLDLHLFLGRPLTMARADVKSDSSQDGIFGKIPQTLIEEELSALMMWSDTKSDVVCGFNLSNVTIKFCNF